MPPPGGNAQLLSARAHTSAAAQRHRRPRSGRHANPRLSSSSRLAAHRSTWSLRRTLTTRAQCRANQLAQRCRLRRAADDRVRHLRRAQYRAGVGSRHPRRWPICRRSRMNERCSTCRTAHQKPLTQHECRDSAAACRTVLDARNASVVYADGSNQDPRAGPDRRNLAKSSTPVRRLPKGVASNCHYREPAALGIGQLPSRRAVDSLFARRSTSIWRYTNCRAAGSAQHADVGATLALTRPEPGRGQHRPSAIKARSTQRGARLKRLVNLRRALRRRSWSGSSPRGKRRAG